MCDAVEAPEFVGEDEARPRAIASCGAMKRIAFLGCLLAACTLGTVAVADDTPAPTVEKTAAQKEAEQRFGRARQLYEEGDYQLALVEFQRAYDLAPNYRVLFNIAQVNIQLQNYAAARTVLEKYLEDGGAEITGARRSQAEADLQMLKGRTAYLRITTNPPADIFIDEKPMGSTPLAAPLLLNGGQHKVVISKRGYLSSTKFVVLAGGDSKEEVFNLVVEPTQEVGPKLTTVSRKNYTPAVIAWSATGAFAISAAIFGGLYINKQSELDDLSDPQKNVTPTARDDAQSNALRLAIVADVLGLVAVGGAAIATYLTLKPPQRAEITTAKVRITPTGIAGTF